MRCGIAFDGWIGRDDELSNFALCEPFIELTKSELFRSYAVQRRQVPHQDKVKAAKTRGIFERHNIGRRLNDAQLRSITT